MNLKNLILSLFFICIGLSESRANEISSSKWVNIPKGSHHTFTAFSQATSAEIASINYRLREPKVKARLTTWASQVIKLTLNNIQWNVPAPSGGGTGGRPPAIMFGDLTGLLQALNTFPVLVEAADDVQEAAWAKEAHERQQRRRQAFEEYQKNNVYLAFDKRTAQPKGISFPIRPAPFNSGVTWMTLIKSGSLVENGKSLAWILSADRDKAFFHCRTTTIKRILQNTKQEGSPNTMLQTLTQAVQRVARAQYFLMKQSQDWGQSGKNTVLGSYAQVHFQLPAAESISGADVKRLQQDIESDTKMASLSLEELRHIMVNPAVELQGKVFHMATETDGINKVLKDQGIPCRIVVGMLDGHRAIILGQSKDLPLTNVTAFVLEKEYARTPAVSLAAAGLSQDYVLVRRESIEYVFNQKWRFQAANLDTPATELPTFLDRFVLTHGYKVGNLEDLEACRDQFIDDLVEFTLRHELGHVQYFEKERSSEQAGREKGLSYLGPNNLVGTLHEPLADWSPGPKGYSGPMRYILQLSQQGDTAQARRMLLNYLSDNCFLDDSGHLSLQGQVDLAIILAFTRGRADFDFTKLNDKADAVTVLMSQTCLETTQKIIERLNAANYEINGNDYSHSQLEGQINKFIGGQDRSSSIYFTARMNNELLLLNRLGKIGYEDVLTYMQTREKNFKQQLLHLVAPQAVEQFGDDLERFIRHQLKINQWI